MKPNESPEEYFMRIVEGRLSVAVWIPEPYGDWYSYAREWCEEYWDEFTSGREQNVPDAAERALDACRLHVLSQARVER